MNGLGRGLRGSDSLIIMPGAWSGAKIGDQITGNYESYECGLPLARPMAMPKADQVIWRNIYSPRSSRRKNKLFLAQKYYFTPAHPLLTPRTLVRSAQYLTAGLKCRVRKSVIQSSSNKAGRNTSSIIVTTSKIITSSLTIDSSDIESIILILADVSNFSIASSSNVTHYITVDIMIAYHLANFLS